MTKKSLYIPYLHHRRSIRLKGYDYSKEGLYFITLNCKNREPLFGEIINGKMYLNAFGQIAYKEWLHTEKIRDNCKIHEFIIMPDHMHGIIEILFPKGDHRNATGKFQSPSQTIGSIIRGYKVATIKKIKKHIEEVDKGQDKAPDKREDKNPNKKGDKSPGMSGDKGGDKSPGMGGDKGEDKDGDKGELQFAPTPTAPTPLTQKIINLNYKIWQRNYYERIIRDKAAYDHISEYIINNPRKKDEQGS